MSDETSTIHNERLRHMNDGDVRDADHVVYWMEQSQRAETNHALEYAIQWANDLGQRLLVVFALMDDCPETNARHGTFQLEGLRDAQQALARRGVRMVVRRGDPAEVAISAANDASILICDRGYLRHQRHWRARVADEAPCRVVQVESDVVVPVETTSQKQEYAARTIRPRIRRSLDRFMVGLRKTPVEKDSMNLPADGVDLSDVSSLIDQLDLDRSVAPVSELYRGGAREARRRIASFIDDRLARYDANRNRPETSDTSHMSMYLHFGQIAPLELALRVRDTHSAGSDDRSSFLEELIVRRELACNYVYFCEQYDSFHALPNWARATMAAHKDDAREHVYTRRELETAQTHDPYWNAAMREMRETGFMHNHMRMYWGKKILEWTNTPEHAFRVALDLNNRYFLDGRDPSSFANVGWIFGLHDRAFQERPVYGKLRFMSQRGLRRKADPDAYVEKVEALIRTVRGDRSSG